MTANRACRAERQCGGVRGGNSLRYLDSARQLDWTRAGQGSRGVLYTPAIGQKDGGVRQVDRIAMNVGQLGDCRSNTGRGSEGPNIRVVVLHCAIDESIRQNKDAVARRVTGEDPVHCNAAALRTRRVTAERKLYGHYSSRVDGQWRLDACGNRAHPDAQ